MLPHRESALAYTYNQHPTPGSTLHICLPQWRVSSATAPTTTITHTLDLTHLSILASHTTREHTHNTAITMVTRPTPTPANAMDTRTPQNTPAQNAPISSRAQAPSVSDIKEGT
jgi:hypothetical protein